LPVIAWKRHYYLPAVTASGKQDACCIVDVLLVLWVYHGKGGDTGKRNKNGIRKTENLKYGLQRHSCWWGKDWSTNAAP